MNSTSSTISIPKYYIAIVGFKNARRVNDLIASCTLYLKTKKKEECSSLQHALENVCIEYLPCIALFGSYQKDEEQIRYLQSLSIYHDKVTTTNEKNTFSKEKKSSKDYNISSLAPYIDDELLYGVIALPSPADNDMICIESFLNTFNNNDSSSSPSMKGNKIPIPILNSIENKSSSLLSKEANNSNKRQEVIESIYNATIDIISKTLIKKDEKSIITSIEKTVVSDNENLDEEIIESKEEEILVVELGKTVKSSPLVTIDPSKNQYACRICRTILFNETHIDYPGHVPSQHSFNKYRNNTKCINASNNASCQNIFLSEPLPWCGTNEGKLSCPKCSSKVGLWKWIGTQCSCGTWVTPAIMINKSRLDFIKKINIE